MSVSVNTRVTSLNSYKNLLIFLKACINHSPSLFFIFNIIIWDENKKHSSFLKILVYLTIYTVLSLWPFKDISVFSNGGQLEWRARLSEK